MSASRQLIHLAQWNSATYRLFLVRSHKRYQYTFFVPTLVFIHCWYFELWMTIQKMRYQPELWSIDRNDTNRRLFYTACEQCCCNLLENESFYCICIIDLFHCRAMLYLIYQLCFNFIMNYIATARVESRNTISIDEDGFTSASASVISH
jgi:hypothetical protein